MPQADPIQRPSNAVRIAPWRGPLSFSVLAVTAALLLLLQLTYLSLIVGGFAWLCWRGASIANSIVAPHPSPGQITLEVVKFILLSITWVFMLRPLRPRPKQPQVAIQVTAATQPQLFELIDTLCWHLRASVPTQVWLDSNISARSSMQGGLSGILTGQTTLHLGLPAISVITSRDLAGLLAHELSYNVAGLSTLFIHAVRETNAWFFRASMEFDAWEMHMRDDVPRKDASHNILLIALGAWGWIAKIPFIILALTARLASLPAYFVLRRQARKCAANLIGAPTMSRMWRKLSLLRDAWVAVMQEVRRGVIQHRIPENLSLLMARHVAQAAKDRASLRAEAGEFANSAGGTAAPAPKGASIVAHLSPAQPAAALMRGFVDLSRQITNFYYQHELALNLHEYRMVGDEEVIHENRQEEEALHAIRRYFGGLAHPERALCGLGSTPVSSTSRADLQREILRVNVMRLSCGGHSSKSPCRLGTRPGSGGEI